MSKKDKDIVGKWLGDLQRAHREEAPPVVPAGNFTTSVMRSVRSLEDPRAQARFEDFLWRMTYIPVACALVIFLYAVPSSLNIGDDLVVRVGGLLAGTDGVLAEIL